MIYPWKYKNNSTIKWGRGDAPVVISHSSAYSNGVQNGKHQQMQSCGPYNIHTLVYIHQTFRETVHKNCTFPGIKSMDVAFSNRKRYQTPMRPPFSPTFLFVKQAHTQEVFNKAGRQCTYEYKRNIEARSRNHCCCGKAISITYCECVCSLSYPAYKEHAPYYIVTYGLSSSTIFFYIIS
jgi:hypothetical protein